MFILRPVIVAVPINKDTNSGESDVNSNCHVSEETLLVDDAFLAR